MDGLIWGCHLQCDREEHLEEQPAGVDGNLPFPIQNSSRAPQLWETPFKQQPTLSKKDNVSPAQTKSTYFPAHLSPCSFKIKSQALPTRRPTKQKCILCTHVRKGWQGCQMFGSRSVTRHHTSLNNR